MTWLKIPSVNEVDTAVVSIKGFEISIGATQQTVSKNLLLYIDYDVFKLFFFNNILSNIVNLYFNIFINILCYIECH